ncbi:MAG: NifU family protein [Candidatus Kapabacteria bacterium]|nr:NifU family protein [Candidatus Kapabacteria bacterium]
MDFLEEKIQETLQNEARVYVESHGGTLEYAGFQDGVVRIRLAGACSTCSASVITVKALVERMLRKKYPEVKRAILVDAMQ